MATKTRQLVDAKPVDEGVYSLPSWVTWVAFCAVVLIGAFVRLYMIAEPAFRADTVVFPAVCRAVPSGSYIYNHWVEIMGYSAQLPFPMAFTKFFVTVTGMEIGPLSMRLPSAIWGILTVIAAWFLGRRLDGLWGSVTFGLVVAMGPCLVLTAREAYFYSPMMLGTFLLVLSMVDSIRDAHGARQAMPWSRHAVAFTGMFFLTHSQPSGWFCAAFVLSIISATSIWRAWKVPSLRSRTAWLIAGFVVIGLPILLSDWGFSQVSRNSSEELRALASRIFAGGPTLGGLLFNAGTSFFIGIGPLRLTLTVLLLIAGITGALLRRKSEPWQIVLPAVMVGGISLFLLVRHFTGHALNIRYVMAYVPLYLSILVLGVAQLARWLATWTPVRSECRSRAGLVILLLVLLAYPCWMATQLRGKPTPYKDIVAWLDANLPKGTMVLVDRWYEPDNEMAMYRPTNVVVTFTVPDDPYEEFVSNRWRETARAFFEKYPDGALLEIAKPYWDRPAGGPWDFPRQRFDRHASISNAAGLVLRRYGLANREDFYAANTNRLVVDVHYSSFSNVVAQMVQKGRPTFVLFGPEWGHVKPWRQTGRFDDYRVLPAAATLRIVHTGDQPAEVSIRLRGVAVGSDKTVVVNTTRMLTFEANMLSEHVLGPIQVAPGETIVQLRDVRPSPNNALWIESVALVSSSRP